MWAKQLYSSHMPDSKTVLIVEDEPLLGNLLKQRLEKDGIIAVLNRDGEEATKTLREMRPDLILLDIILPKVSGFELMETMKADPTIERAPIIIVSNLGQDADIERGRSLGAIEYFIKAKMSIEDLVVNIKRILAGGNVVQ